MAIRLLTKLFGNQKVAAKAAKAVEGTVVKPSLPGTTILERQFGDKLFKTETQVLADGTKKTTTLVYGSNGKLIGSGDNGLDVFRETLVARQKGGSVLGGDKVVINKNYHDTMAMSRKFETTVKEYTPEGILEHAETKILNPYATPRLKTTTFDRTKSLTGETTAYSQAIEAQKAQKAATEAAKEAVLKAEQEAAAKLAAESPRVNVGKVFGKNLDEFKVMEEKVLADGTKIKKYAAKDKNGHSQYIVTKDKGSYHEEYIVDMARDMKIKYTQIGNAEPKITMSRGLQYRQTSEIATAGTGADKYQYRKEAGVYDDGLSRVELLGDSSYGRTRIHIKNPNTPEVQALCEQPAYYNLDVRNNEFYGNNKVLNTAQRRLSEITADVKQKFMNLMDLFKPYKS